MSISSAFFGANFSYKSSLRSFSLDTFGFVIFGTKIWYEKCARKTLMKLTEGGLWKKAFHVLIKKEDRGRSDINQSLILNPKHSES